MCTPLVGHAVHPADSAVAAQPALRQAQTLAWIAVLAAATLGIPASAQLKQLTNLEPPVPAMTQVISVWDANRDRQLTEEDVWFTGSGVMIGPRHVLTCAHLIHENGTGREAPHPGFADWVFVHPGCLGPDHRPYGQAQVVNLWVTEAWQRRADNADLGIVALDRAVGRFTGYLPVAPFPGLGHSVRLYHYPGTGSGPAGEAFDGWGLFAATGRPFASGPDFFRYYQQSLFTTVGSSGGPLVRVVNAEAPAVVGIHVRNAVNLGRQSGYGVAAKLDGHLDWIRRVLRAELPPARDEPVLMDGAGWLPEGTAQLPAQPDPESRPTLQITIFNGGTRASPPVMVRLQQRLGDAGPAASAETSIPSIPAYRTHTCPIRLPVALTAGAWQVQWTIDPAAAADNAGALFDERLLRMDGRQAREGSLEIQVQ